VGFCFFTPTLAMCSSQKINGLLQIEWVIFSIYNGGNMQVKTFRRKYSSSRNP
jgi:hypothetical protein